jgi:hypothetical protein
MNDDVYQDVPPPYSNASGNQVPESSGRIRSISAQIKKSLQPKFVARERGKSAQPTNNRPEIVTSSLYPSLSDADLLFIPVENTQSESKSIQVYIKEIWEAGLGVHIGIFKKLSKIADNGGETSWRISKLEWTNNQLISRENSKITTIPLKHSAFGVDKNSAAHPHTLTIQQVNGTIIKVAFPTLNDLNSWRTFLIDKQRFLK